MRRIGYWMLLSLCSAALTACGDDNEWDVKVELISGSKCTGFPTSGRIHIYQGGPANSQTVMQFVDPFWWNVPLDAGGGYSGKVNSYMRIEVTVPSGKGPRNIIVSHPRVDCMFRVVPK
jgi:hypothetical protein